jgi:hypothetical protein
LLGLALAVSACGRGVPPLKKGENVVRGSVTYGKKPVTYGYVLFYRVAKKKGTEAEEFIAPVSVAEIRTGKYEAENVPFGPMKVCVVTDPDVLQSDLIPIPGKQHPGGPQKKGKDKGMKLPPPKDPKEGFDKKENLVPDPNNPTKFIPDPLGPKGPHDPNPKPPFFNPRTAKMTAKEKEMLREIHAKYGTLDQTPLQFTINEAEQTLNLPLLRGGLRKEE